jgi:cyclopropane fatty-acyl-phospholipid synthase-like methyltransferase
VTLLSAAACERNREPIAARLAEWLPARGRVLEIGSGTGQHAVYFGERFPGIVWQTSDVAGNHPGIRARIEAAGLGNVLEPLELDVARGRWPQGPFDAVYTANTAHIMPMETVAMMFAGVDAVLAAAGFFFLYGPVNRRGEFTSPSNLAFDAELRARDPRMGLRDDRALLEFARTAGLELAADYVMPANNRSLVFRRARGAA